MSKRAMLGIVIIAGLISQAAYSELVYSNDFSGLSSMTDAGWVANGTVPVTDGVVEFGNRKARYILSESYALDAGAGADNTVNEIWMHVRASFPGDADIATIRMGLGTTTFDYTVDGGRYAGFHIQADSDLSTFVQMQALSQAVTGADVDPLPANDGFVDIYCKMYNNASSNLVTELWVNPEDPNNLGTAQSIVVQEYSYSRVIDTLDINAWGSSVNHEIDSIEVWTVNSEPTGDLELYSNDFSGFSSLLDAGWVANGTVPITDDVVQFGNRKARYVLSESYALDEDTEADNHVKQIWMHVHASFPGDSDIATIRMGLGTTTFDYTVDGGRYAGFHVQADSDLSTLVQVKAVSQSGTGANVDPLPANDGFVDIYCKMYNNASSNLVTELWINPEDPDNLGAAQSTAIHTYSYSRVIDTLDINAWGSNEDHLIDSVEVWAPTSGYILWAGDWGVNLGSITNDYDGDRVNNLVEYALGGNPTNALDRGETPTFEFDGSNMVYTYPRRSDDTSLTYTLKTTDDLVSGVWTNTGYSVAGTNVTGDTMDYVTNTIPVTGSQFFINLEVEKN